MQHSRRGVLGTGLGFLAGGVASYLLQTTDERVTDLEATVTSLDERVTALEARAGITTPTAGATPDAIETPSSDWPTISGAGNSVTEKFALDSGRYKVHATLDALGFSGFIAVFYPPAGSEDYVFSAIVQDAGPWTAEAIYEAPESGEYFVEVSNVNNMAEWSLAFEPY